MLADVLKLQLDLAGAQAELATGPLTGRWLRSLAPIANDAKPVRTLPGSPPRRLAQPVHFQPGGGGRYSGQTGFFFGASRDTVQALLQGPGER